MGGSSEKQQQQQPGTAAAAAAAAPPSPQPSSRPHSRFAVYDLEGTAAAAPPPLASPAAASPAQSFHKAAERGDTSTCVRLIERSVAFDINVRDRLGRTALHWAAEMGPLDTVQVLLDCGIDVSAVDVAGRTAMHAAAKGGAPAVLEALLAAAPGDAAAALVNAADSAGLTPVYLALQRGDEGIDVFKCLLQHGAVYNEPMPAGLAAAAAAAAKSGEA